MAEVTVRELAKMVSAPEERLLKQMREAGLKHSSASDPVSDAEKQQLLAYLKTLHGAETAEPRKIVLKRKTTETLKTSGAGGRKTVNVEVRKKRTYVKREEGEITRQAEEEKLLQDAQETLRTADPRRSSPIDDAEKKRVAAIESRRRAEEDERLRAAEETRRRTDADARRRGGAQVKAPPVEPVIADPATVEALIENPTEKAGRDQRVERGDDLDEEGKPKKKKAGGRVKPHNPVLDSADKDWRKHSHRPQDFELHEDENEEQRRKRLTDAQKIVKPLKNMHTFKKPTGKIVHEIDVPESITVADLAQRMAIKSGELIRALMKMGEMATINQSIDQVTAVLVIEEFGHKARLISMHDDENAMLVQNLDLEANAKLRAPVVTVMGHVDHGKTSLLDRIRQSRVASGEAGGITQHIGAYSVQTAHGQITFLDTPGHAAFTAMRARGAKATDVVILVVAGDDGVMPQTKEAVLHSKAAGVPIVVAINKMDKEGADPERVKNELVQIDVIPEDWGGDVPFVPVSAHTGEGIDTLLETISIIAEMAELKAVNDGPARGVVIESRLEKGRGVVTSLLVQSGALTKGDIILAGTTYGRVRAISNDMGQTVDSAGPSTPVEVLGLDEPPEAGEEFLVLADERIAREVAVKRQGRAQERKQARERTHNLENIFANLEESAGRKELPILIKSDVHGSAEAIAGALAELGNDEVRVNLIASGVGGISESDINLALTTGAIVIGFNVRADSGARKLSEREGVEIRYYSIIYQLIDEIKQALSGMLDPETREEIVGIAEVRDVFRSPKYGQIAGCMVVEGTVYRNKPIRVLRDNVVIFEGQLESLRRFKDDASEVRNGMECGIGVKDYNDVQPGDQIEVFEVSKVQRSL